LVLRELEQFRMALLTVFHAPADLPTGRLPVIAVARGWDDFADANVSGFCTRTLFQPLVVMRGEGDLARQQVIKHELVHYFSHMIMPVQPRWLSEGLASYFETLEYDDEKGEATLGRPPPELLSSVQRQGPLSPEEIAAAKPLAADTGRFYATSWLLVHFLMNHRTDSLARYEAALRQRIPLPDAWKAAFGALTAQQLHDELRAYMDGGQYALLVYKLPPASGETVGTRVLTDAEVHATRAELFVQGGRGPRRDERVDLPAPEEFRARAREEVAEALRQEPTQDLARAIAAFDLGGTLDLAQAQVSVERDPSDWMGWLLLSKALEQHGIVAGRVEAAARATALANQDPSVALPAR
jgi:hypothetical protein